MKCPYCGADNVAANSSCPYCGGAVPAENQNTNAAGQNTYAPAYSQSAAQKKAVKEFPITGAFGALIGSLLGVASIVIFSQMDRVAAISGLILAFCTLKGYELLGQKLSTKGIVICIIIMLLAPVLAYAVNLTIYVHNEFSIPIGDAIKLVMEIMTSGSFTISDFLQDNFLVYAFTALGAFGIVSNAIKENKN